tara:strand:+ start:877 stop:1830 length:954 start_codon:yes stop_codon:yes gene_type:complete
MKKGREDLKFSSSMLINNKIYEGTGQTIEFTENHLWILGHDKRGGGKIEWMNHNNKKYFNEKKFFPVTVDSFFRNPYKIVNYAKTLSMSEDPYKDWPGKRSKNLQEILPDLSVAIIQKILFCYGSYDCFKTQQAINISMHFQEINCAEPNDKHDVLNRGWIHTDFSPSGHKNELAGLIYLSPNIDPDSGTSLFNRIPITQEIEQEYYKIREEANEIKKTRPKTKNEKLHYEEVYLKYEKYFLEQIRFQNVFNRMIVYDTNEFHRANNYYSGTEKESRLTLVFFIEGIQMKETYPLQRVKDIELENIIEKSYITGEKS